MKKLLFAVSMLGFAACGSAAGDEVVKKMEGFKTAACACKDLACAQKVAEDMSKYMEEMAKKDVQGTESQGKKIAALGEELGKCIAKLAPAAP